MPYMYIYFGLKIEGLEYDGLYLCLSSDLYVILYFCVISIYF